MKELKNNILWNFDSVFNDPVNSEKSENFLVSCSSRGNLGAYCLDTSFSIGHFWSPLSAEFTAMNLLRVEGRNLMPLVARAEELNP